MTDILSIQPVVRTLTVKHPATGEPIGLEIDFRSLDSEEVRAVERQLKTKSLRSGRPSRSAEKQEESEYDVLHALTAAWRWAKGLKLGTIENPPLTRVNSEKLYRSAPWIKRQLDEELQDESGFFTTAENVSSPSSSGG